MSTILITDRLVIRHMEQRDFDALYALFNDPEVMRYYPSTRDRDETQTWMDWVFRQYEQHGHGLFIVEHVDTGEFIGQVGIIYQQWDDRPDLEVGYMLARKHWGNGYATEAARAMRDYAFARFRADRVVSFITPQNTPSQAVAKRNGMRILKRIKHPRLDLDIDIWGLYSNDTR